MKEPRFHIWVWESSVQKRGLTLRELIKISGQEKNREKMLMDGARRSPVVSGLEVQEEPPKKWPKSYDHSQLLYKPWGEAFKREHMIIKDDDRGQVDERPALVSLERAEEWQQKSKCKEQVYGKGMKIRKGYGGPSLSKVALQVFEDSSQIFFPLSGKMPLINSTDYHMLSR